LRQGYVNEFFRCARVLFEISAPPPGATCRGRAAIPSFRPPTDPLDAATPYVAVRSTSGTVIAMQQLEFNPV
jgi:hypothetical protein